MNDVQILLRDIHVAVSFRTAVEHDSIALSQAKKIYDRALRSRFGAADFHIHKRSVDARDKQKIRFIYTVAACPKESLHSLPDVPSRYTVYTPTEPNFSVKGTPAQKPRPIVVGFGPAGMFCAYALARAGLAPLVIERGGRVDKRVERVEAYWKNGTLDENTNVQFGEGGAGTFSDGKLLTRISDPLCGYVLKTLHAFGAPKDILYLAKPHVGTDNLRVVVKNIREEIIRLGGSFLFDTTFLGYSRRSDDTVCSVQTSAGDFPCTALFLCIGHSARDTFALLEKNSFALSPKPFSVGVRVEHLQEDIDRALYGKSAGCPALGPASYTLSAKTDGRAVYSFCMCPGGTVVASADAKGEIVTNGMSNYARDGRNANSAIAVSIAPTDYGATPDGAIAFQKQIETAAFSLAGSNGAAPIQLLGDFMGDSVSSAPSRILPTYTGKTALCSLSALFPPYVSSALKNGFGLFERHIEGFSVSDAVLTAPETRTSSPVRMDRMPNGISVSAPNIYPCGEGAGYAGGITSAAVDGLKNALAYLQRLSEDV